ncbi:RelA/SpoT domain-containing protein [Psychromonas sp.]|uniref:RelA/SpoT domain-containing protein n=1 Tax=Psychromonas sp. TaxID=1884585 RepID=UPI0035663EC3
MSKLFQTLFVVMAISSQANASTVKSDQRPDNNKLLPLSQPGPRNSQPHNLAGLFSIKEYQSSYLKQPYNDFDLLYQKAILAQSELETVIDQIALKTNAYTFSSGLKSKQRAMRKITLKHAGRSEKITDLVRTSIVAQDVPTLINSFELLAQQTQLVRIKNRFANPNCSGYRDLSLLLRLPESGIIAEVQLHLEAFSFIKNGEEHNNYEQIQQIELLQISERRGLSEIELTAIDKLRRESKLLYQQAWQQYLSA